VRKLAYWLGPLPTLAFAHQRLKAQLALEQLLEEQVSERTRQLTDANQRLRGEIDTRTHLEDQLRRRHKAEAVGRLAGGVAHDFNNILTTIGVYAELLEDGLPPDSPLREEVDRIRRAQLRASDLTQQLLTLGRRSQVPTERLDLGSVIADLASLLRHMLAEHTLKLRLHEGPLPILANLDQLQQIAINLVLNARDAMQEPGRMTIETALCEAGDAGERLGPELAGGRFAVLIASDTGVGMAPETRERAFDPFFSTKGPGRGSGLGLSTLHGVVSQAGGAVHLESEPGRGARFELYWPLAGVGVRPSVAGPAPQPEGQRASILLVEDEEAVRSALELVLTNAGHQVTAASDGQQALDWVSDPDAHCDLVITDVVMPRMSGLELARSLATARPEVRVILISGHLDDPAMHEWDDHFPFLAKPFAPGDLTRKVREVLAPVAATA
jgi:signal transduction histidine kinase